MLDLIEVLRSYLRDSHPALQKSDPTFSLSSHGDWQTNLLFFFPEVDPHYIAKHVYELDDNRVLASCFITGRKFINFKFKENTFDKVTHIQHSSKPERYIIDFGGFNIGKRLHVGHIRTLILGQSLYRLMKICGYNITSDIHLGDYGLQAAIVAHEITTKGYVLEEVNLSLMHQLYIEGMGSFTNNEDYKKTIQSSVLPAICTTSSSYNAVWRHIRALSIKHIKEICNVCNVTYDKWDGESDAAPYLPVLKDHKEVVEDLGTKGIHVPSGFFMFFRQNSTPLYSATDMATIMKRHEEGIDTSIYVVDSRQRLHFTKLEEACTKMSIHHKVRLVGFEQVTINNNHISSRAQNSSDLLSILQQAKNSDSSHEHFLLNLYSSVLQVDANTIYKVQHNSVWSNKGLCNNAHLLSLRARLHYTLECVAAGRVTLANDLSQVERNLYLYLSLFKQTLEKCATKLTMTPVVKYALQLNHLCKVEQISEMRLVTLQSLYKIINILVYLLTGLCAY